MSYSHLVHDPLDLDPPSDIPFDEELMITSHDETHVYQTATSNNSKNNNNNNNNSIHSIHSYHSQNNINNNNSPNNSIINNNSLPHSPSHLSSPSSTSLIISPIEDKRKSYPFSIVWGSLPFISWCLPCIGHLGICDSRGEIHDFHGPYDVRKGRFMVGPVLRYYQLPQDVLEQLNIETGEQWDQAVYKSDLHYSGTVHNIVSNNCHHHVATALSNVGYHMSMMDAWWLIMTKGKWVSGRKAVCSVFLPFTIFWGLIIAIIVIFTTISFSGSAGPK